MECNPIGNIIHFKKHLDTGRRIPLLKKLIAENLDGTPICTFQFEQNELSSFDEMTRKPGLSVKTVNLKETSLYFEDIPVVSIHGKTGWWDWINARPVSYSTLPIRSRAEFASEMSDLKISFEKSRVTPTQLKIVNQENGDILGILLVPMLKRDYRNLLVFEENANHLQRQLILGTSARILSDISVACRTDSLVCNWLLLAAIAFLLVLIALLVFFKRRNN